MFQIYDLDCCSTDRLDNLESTHVLSFHKRLEEKLPRRFGSTRKVLLNSIQSIKGLWAVSSAGSLFSVNSMTRTKKFWLPNGPQFQAVNQRNFLHRKQRQVPYTGLPCNRSAPESLRPLFSRRPIKLRQQAGLDSALPVQPRSNLLPQGRPRSQQLLIGQGPIFQTP